MVDKVGEDDKTEVRTALYEIEIKKPQTTTTRQRIFPDRLVSKEKISRQNNDSMVKEKAVVKDFDMGSEWTELIWSINDMARTKTIEETRRAIQNSRLNALK